MAKINEMNKEQLIDALDYMSKIPINDPNFSSFNFDSEDWKDKFIELVDALRKILDKVE